MKRLPPTPPDADPETLRWVANCLERNQVKLDALAFDLPRDHSLRERFYAQADYACAMKTQLRNRATRLDRQRRKRGRDGR